MKAKVLLVASIVLVFASIANAQTNSRTINISYGMMESTFPVGPINQPSTSFMPTKMHSVVVDANLWQFGKYLQGGFYLGASPSSYTEYVDASEVPTIVSTVGMRLGMRAQLHLLSLAGKESTRWDVALTGVLGTSYNPGSSMQKEYGLGLMVGYYPWQHFGVVVEHNWGSFKGCHSPHATLLESHIWMKVGLSYRF